MTVLLKATGEKAEYNAAYAERLIEQGRAVAAPPAEKKAVKAPKAEKARKK